MENKQNPGVLRASHLNTRLGQVQYQRNMELNDEMHEILSSYSPIIALNKVPDQNLIEVELQDGSLYRLTPNQYTQLLYDKIETNNIKQGIRAKTQPKTTGLRGLWQKFKNIFRKKDYKNVPDLNNTEIHVNLVNQHETEEEINNVLNKFFGGAAFLQSLKVKEEEAKVPVIKADNFFIENSDGEKLADSIELER